MEAAGISRESVCEIIESSVLPQWRSFRHFLLSADVPNLAINFVWPRFVEEGGHLADWRWKKGENLAAHLDSKRLLPETSRKTKTMQTQEDLPSPN